MIFPLLAATLLFVAQNPEPAQPAAPPAETASASLFATDARLVQKVTFASPSVTINEALQQFTTQTGVPVKMRDSKIIGAQKIAFFAEQVEARQVLEAIAALLRYKNITSEWQKDATGDGYALSIGGQYYAAAARKAENSTDPRVLLTNVMVNGKPLLDSINPDDVVVNRSEDGKVVTMTVSSSQSVPGPAVNATITRPATTVDGASAPNVITRSGQKPTAGSAMNSIKAKKPVVEDWFTRYDSPKSAVETATIAADAIAAQPAPNSLAGALSALARTQNVPVIALLPDSFQAGDGGYNGGMTGDKTVAALLITLNNSSYKFSHKWHKGALLLRDPMAPFREPLPK